MIVTPTECNVNGDFYVNINFNHSGTPSPQFKVQGNGKNYGTFAYDSLPIQIGPLKADCTTNFEFIVRDFENSNCTAFKNLGKKCCDNNCSITIKDVKVGNCDGSFYSLGFDIDHNASGVGFDVYNNGQFFGYYKYAALPISIPNLENSNSEAFNQIVVCANDNPTCCDTIKIANPCICSIYKIKSQVINCNEQDSTFSLKINFKHHLTADSFQVGGNTNNYGVFAYKDLPITIRGLKFSNTIDYEFLFVDRNDAFCFASYQLGFVKNCNFPCNITDINADISACDESGNFYANISFKEKNTSIAGFNIRGNGQNYGNFEYGENNYKVGPLKGDCKTIYEFVVKDIEIEGCLNAIGLKDSVCCNAQCALSNLTISEICDGDKLTAYEIDFDYQNTLSDQFSLRINNSFVGMYQYSDLPLKITHINFDKAIVSFKIWDKENEACNLIKDYTFKCKLNNDCKIYDLVVTASDCNDKGEFYAKIKFKYQNTGNQNFAVKVNGVLFDTLPYGLNVYEIGPLKGDCSTLYKFLVYDYQFPDCGEDYTFTEKVCCDQGDCSITDFQVKASECNDNGEFFAIIKFKSNNTGNQGFVVKVNGVFYDSLAYGKEVYEIGPLKGDCSTLYKFLIYDRQFEACRADFAFTEKVCCEKEECSIKNPLLTFSECTDKTYNLVLDFTHSGTTPKFRVKVNGAVKGTYNFNQLPITIVGLEEKIAHEIVIWDIENEACKMVFSVPGIVCTSGTADELAEQVTMSVSNDVLKVNTQGLGIQKRLMIFDMQGKLYSTQTSDLFENQIDISVLPSGMYIIGLEINQYKINKKFIKH
ncbi:MAG: T9SS type A sorting domain-containing protein [Saprospiraceae bacterium]|nr:T9SS type A sorting domain-containing protein [Saprospiraceae bacterium]